jgi:low affinity Fe/Cu permease
MAFIDVLYIVIAVAVVVITVTVVWLSNELIGLIKSVKRSSQDSEKVTKEIKEKVLLISESLDRAGSAASSLVGLMEDAVEGIKPRRDRVAESLAVISGAANYSKSQQQKESQVGIIKEDKGVEKETENKKTSSDKKKTVKK